MGLGLRVVREVQGFEKLGGGLLDNLSAVSGAFFGFELLCLTKPGCLGLRHRLRLGQDVRPQSSLLQRLLLRAPSAALGSGSFLQAATSLVQADSDAFGASHRAPLLLLQLSGGHPKLPGGPPPQSAKRSHKVRSVERLVQQAQASLEMWSCFGEAEASMQSGKSERSALGSTSCLATLTNLRSRSCQLPRLLPASPAVPYSGKLPPKRP